jgi:hypothetical protein
MYCPLLSSSSLRRLPADYTPVTNVRGVHIDNRLTYLSEVVFKSVPYRRELLARYLVGHRLEIVDRE